MNVQTLADQLAGAHDLPKNQARAIVDSLFDSIAAAAKGGEEVALPGFGKFKVRDRKARQARNPQTGKTVKVPASKKLAFLPAKALKDMINGVKAKAKAAPKAAAKGAAKPAAKGAAKSAAKGAAKPAAKAAPKAAAKSAAKSPAKSAAKPMAKPTAKPAAKGKGRK